MDSMLNEVSLLLIDFVILVVMALFFDFYSACGDFRFYEIQNVD